MLEFFNYLFENNPEYFIFYEAYDKLNESPEKQNE